jgi:hypothetical protein
LFRLFRIHAPQQTASLFDDLVGAGEQRGRRGEIQHPRSFRPNERAAKTLLVFLDGLDKMS